MGNFYLIKECFYSLQGEGHRSGTANVFLRFSQCNLQCVDGAKLGRPVRGNEVDAGFNCDTDFQNGTKMSLDEVVEMVERIDTGSCYNIILTGGEPTLQADFPLIKALIEMGYYIAIETNGLRPVPYGVNWISCSPKPGTTPVLTEVDEVRCVVAYGQEPDTRGVFGLHLYVSPACHAPLADKIHGWKASPDNLDAKAMEWAVDWCKTHPTWRVSVQLHKVLGIR